MPYANMIEAIHAHIETLSPNDRLVVANMVGVFENQLKQYGACGAVAFALVGAKLAAEGEADEADASNNPL